MSGDLGFLEFLREAPAGKGRGNEELLRAMLPLLDQLVQVHDAGRVGPLDGVGRLFVDGSHVWFHAAEATAPTLVPDQLRAIQRVGGDGIEVVGRGALDLDLNTGARRLTEDQRLGEAAIEHPVFVPSYSSWEQEIGHHDALTDVFSAGMLFASLALGLDFTEPMELQRFIEHRHGLTRLNGSLHPVLARAIVRMTEPNRHQRAQDLPALIARLRSYREVDERVDTELDFTAIPGFVTADRSSRRRIIQTHLQSRLFDISRRNRLIWFQPTQQMIDLTMASVPTQLAVETIRADELFLWSGAAGRELTEGKAIRLERYLRFEEAPWIRGTLDKVRGEDRRSRTEVGFSQLRLVIAFLNWHNLKDNADERIRSPLLLLPVSLTLQRGVRNSTVLQAQSELAEVNPVLRHHLQEVYGLELPDQVDLSQSDVETFHKALAAAIARSEPGVSLHLLTRPQIRLLRETAVRRNDLWRRRSNTTGRGLKTEQGVDFSYSRSNFQPLGLQLYRQLVKPEEFLLDKHLQTAAPILASEVRLEPDEAPAEGSDDDDDTTRTSRSVYLQTEGAAGPYDWAVDLTHCTLGNFNYRKMSLVRDFDRMLAEDEGHEHPSFDTLFSLEARDLEAPPTDETSPLDLFAVVPADPSQAAAVRWARTGRSFIIQGPPGTGKSQTIANLIADFAASGKRVLFVCQKRAALDVVYHRLAQHRLDELSVLIHDAQGDKKEFIDDLKQTYTAWTNGSVVPSVEARRAEVIDQLDEPLQAIGRFADGMRGPVAGGDAAVIEVIGARLRQGPLPDLEPDQAEQIPSHRAWIAHRAAVHDAARALVDAGESPVFSRLALRHVGREILDAAQPLGALRQGLSELSQLLDGVRSAWTRMRPDATSADLAEALALAQKLQPLLPDRLSLLDPESGRSLQLESLLSERTAAERALSKAVEQTEHWHDKLTPADTTTALTQARSFDAQFFLFRWLTPAWWALRGLLRKRYFFGKHAVQPSYAEVLEGLAAEHEGRAALGALDERARDLFRFDGDLPAFGERVRSLRDPTAHTPLQVELARSWATDAQAVHAVLAATRSIDLLRQVADRVFDGGHRIGFDVLEQRVAETRKAADLLPEVLGPLRQLHEAGPEIREAVRTLPLTPSQWDAAVSQQALERTLRADRVLARFGDEGLRKRQTALSDGTHELLAVNARVVRERVRRRFQERVNLSGRSAAELTPPQKALKASYNAGRRVLEREFEKVMRHKSIRELSEGDTGTVVYDLKPIWLMSPLSISDTIPLGEERFDVVIFDEASQIPLEEAVPAVYRAPQMIVVGDEMQLPPTSFFAASRAPDDTERDEAVSEVHYDLDADSFLSHSARCLSSTLLSWHYRSRHEALIRFSNQAFYAGRLLTVPDRLRGVERDPIRVSDWATGDARAAQVLDRPVSYHRLEDSPYSNRTNAGEATYIAHLVRGLLRSEAGHTVGIVAFSEAQQGLIEGALDGLAAEDPVFRRELDQELEREDEGQMVGLFVKNLENVQGDERDVIVLSICYGPDAKGSMRMNFGPINKGGGEKRLNVVFSRAKRHMAVVASIDHSAITNQYNDGANCLRRYLQYSEAASRGDDTTTDLVARALNRDDGLAATQAAANPVIEDLQEALEAQGLVVVPNLGSSGFQVDLAVGRDDRDALTVAVLVDTPAFYERCDAYEANHIRPSVLRAFGWTVVHVLSKDWLVDRAGCLARVVRAVEDPDAFAPPPPPALEPEPEPVFPEPVSPEPEMEREPEREPTHGGAEVRLAGSTVVFTGALSGLTRAEADQLVIAAGGRVASAVTRNTTYLVVGARPGSKVDEAKRKGVAIVDEAGFRAAVAGIKGRA